MSLSLQELMKKAADKGITALEARKNNQGTILRPWQQESVLFETKNSEVATKQQQSDNKPATNRQQNRNRQQTGNKPTAQPATEVATNRQQTDNKPTTKSPFSTLVGLQRALVIFIYSACKETRSKYTESLTLEHISNVLKTSNGSIKTTIQRLESKKIITRSEYKSGRGGWSKYTISDSLFQELLQYESNNKLATNWQQTGNKPTAQPTTQPATTLSSSSSIIYNNKTTTEQGVNEHLDIDHGWLNIDLEPLALISFTHDHLKQIFQKGQLSVEQVQDSIFAFAFDLKYNQKAKNMKGSPLNYFMGILRNGRVYTPPANYESPVNKSLRMYYERKKELNLKQQEMEDGLFELEFKEWEKCIGDEEKNKLLPEDIKNSRLSGAKLAGLKTYFKEQVWPEKLQSILNNELLQLDLTKAI